LCRCAPARFSSSLTGLKSVPSPTSLAALRTRCGHFAFAFTRNRERPSAIRRAWARALTATTVRPRSAAMSKTEALAMTSSRSRLSSSDVQAFALFIFFASFLRGHARFRALDAAGFFASALAARLPLMVLIVYFSSLASARFDKNTCHALSKSARAFRETRREVNFPANLRLQGRP
jgi:hypothetical protein